MTSERIDEAARVIRDLSEVDGETIGYAHAHNIAQSLVDAGLLRPPASKRYDSTTTNLPSFSSHVGGAYIEASIEKRYRKNTLATFARVYIELDGEHGAACVHVDTNSEWCRAAAAILLDVADALDTTQEKK